MKIGYFVIVLLLLSLIVFPFFMISLFSIVPVWVGTFPDNFGLIWWKEIFSKPIYINAILNSVAISFLSMCACMGYGILAGYLFSFYDFRGKSFLQSLILSPTYVACVIVSFGLLIAFPNIRNSIWMMVIANFVVVSPLTFKYVHSSMEKIELNIIEASYSLGSSKVNTFWRIILPLSRKGILAGTVLSMGMCMSALSVLLLLYSPKWAPISVMIYLESKTGSLGVASGLSVILMAVSIVTIFVVDLLEEKI